MVRRREMQKEFSLKDAIERADKGQLEEWIHEFLLGEGSNEGFSKGLKLTHRYYMYPVKMPLNLFKRCCGPEENMRFRTDTESFEKKVARMQNDIEEGWDVPPLIIGYYDDTFELNDGNHRFEALVRSGAKEYYTIIWITEKKDYEEFEKKYFGYYDTLKMLANAKH